jgi:hypothetical protein
VETEYLLQISEQHVRLADQSWRDQRLHFAGLKFTLVTLFIKETPLKNITKQYYIRDVLQCSLLEVP